MKLVIIVFMLCLSPICLSALSHANSRQPFPALAGSDVPSSSLQAKEASADIDPSTFSKVIEPSSLHNGISLHRYGTRWTSDRS